MAKEPKMRKFTNFIKVDNLNMPSPPIQVISKLNPGMYDVELTQHGELRFHEINYSSDAIIDLPDPVYAQVVNDLESFMKKDTKAKFDEKGYVYKRSSLLYGQAGTGKTVLVNRIAAKVIESGGTVLFNPNPLTLSAAFMALDSVQPDVLTMVIFEELDEVLEHYESQLLNVLDGEIQKNNVLYMATTNHIEKIPARIKRPGRFSSVVEVRFPTPQARELYLTKKLTLNKDQLDQWVKVTEGFSIDELSETVRANYCLGQPLADVVNRIKTAKADLAQSGAEESDDDDWGEDYKEDKESPFRVSGPSNGGMRKGRR